MNRLLFSVNSNLSVIGSYSHTHLAINISIPSGTYKTIDIDLPTDGTYWCKLFMRSDAGIGGTAFIRLGENYEKGISLINGTPQRWQWDDMTVITGDKLSLTIIAEADVSISTLADLWVVRIK